MLKDTEYYIEIDSSVVCVHTYRYYYTYICVDNSDQYLVQYMCLFSFSSQQASHEFPLNGNPQNPYCSGQYVRAWLYVYIHTYMYPGWR